MQVLTQSQIISNLAERVGVPKRQVASVLENLVTLAIEQCQTVGSFVIPGFGTAIKKYREARWGRDQNGQPFRIIAKDVVKLYLDPGFKKAVSSAQKERIVESDNGPQDHLGVVDENKPPSEEPNDVNIEDRAVASSTEGVELPPKEAAVPVVKLPFELLPPGTWDIEHVINYYRGRSDRIQTQFAGRELDLKRLKRLKSLGPDKCYVGTE